MKSLSYRDEEFELKVVFDLQRRNVGRIRVTDKQVSLSYRGEMFTEFELMTSRLVLVIEKKCLPNSSYRGETYPVRIIEEKCQNLSYRAFCIEFLLFELSAPVLQLFELWRVDCIHLLQEWLGSTGLVRVKENFELWVFELWRVDCI